MNSRDELLLVKLNNVLEESAEKYEFLINNILDVIVELDLDGYFSYVSPRVYDMLGYHPEELIRNQFFSYIRPDDMEIIIKNFKKAITGKGSIRLEYRIKHKEGHYVAVCPRGSLVKISDELKLVGVLRDITQKEVAELELEKEKEKLQLYLDTVGVMVVALNKYGEITLINRKGCDVLGYTEEELMGKNWFLACLSDSIKNDVYEVFQKLMRNEIEATEFYENSVKTKNSNQKIIAWHNTVLTDEEGNIIGTLSSGEDITDRKKAEELLKQSEEKYRMIFSGASDPIAILNGNKIIDCNKLAVKLFGYNNEDDIIGKPPWEISPQKQPDGRDSDEKANLFIEKALQGEPQRFYWKHLKKDDSLFDAEVSLSSFKLENRDYVMAIIRDITERKKVEREIREISRLKTELLERTSHELKTPLISIKGFTNLLLELHKDKFDDDVYSILGEIRQGTEHLESIINGLLETSLLESGKVQFKPCEKIYRF